MTKKQKPIVYITCLIIALQLVSLAIKSNGLQNPEDMNYSSNASVDDSLIEADGCSELAHWGQSFGDAYDIVIQESLLSKVAYVAAGSGGLLLYDVSNPSNPKFLGQYTDGGGITQVIVVEKYAFVTGGDFGLKILNIGSPKNPKRILDFDEVEYLSNIEIFGDYIFGLQWGYLLQTIDISNPRDPILSNTLDISSEAFEVEDIKIKENYLYAIKTDSVEIFDISNPKEPVSINQWEFEVSIRGFDFYGFTAIIASSTYDVFFYNMTNPSNFTLISRFRDSRCLSSFIEVFDHYAFCFGDQGFICFDVENPSNIIKIGEFIKQFGYSLSGYIREDFVYLLDHFRGVEIIYIGDLTTAPLSAGQIITNGYSIDTFVQGKIAYVTNFMGGLEILDIDNPTNPKLITRYAKSTSYYTCMYLENSKLYLANYITSSIEILDVSDPSAPVQISSSIDDTFILWPESKLKVKDNIAFIIEIYGFSHIFDGILYIVNCTNPADVVLINTLTGLDTVFNDLYLYGNHLFLASESGLLIYEIDDDYNLTFVSEYSDLSSLIAGVYVENDHVFLAALDYGLIILDISDIENPVLSSSYDTDRSPSTSFGGYDVYLENNIIYLLDLDEGLLVFDGSDPNNPTPIGSYNRYEYYLFFDEEYREPVHFFEIFVSKNVVFLPSGPLGLLIVHHDDLPTHWMSLQKKLIISVSTIAPLIIGGLIVLVVLRIKKRR